MRHRRPIRTFLSGLAAFGLAAALLAPSTVAYAAENVVPDAAFRACLNESLNPTDLTAPITAADLEGFTGFYGLNCSDADISSVEGARYLTGFKQLVFADNRISDLRPLASMTWLEQLVLVNNNVSDLRPLAGMTSLKQLWLDANLIEDLSPLSKLTNLTTLSLYDNWVEDLSPLAGLANLTQLDLEYNAIWDISPLKGLKKLTALDLDSNSITDLRPLPVVPGWGCTANTNTAINQIVEYGDIEPGDYEPLPARGDTHGQVRPIHWEISGPASVEYATGDFTIGAVGGPAKVEVRWSDDTDRDCDGSLKRSMSFQGSYVFHALGQAHVYEVSLSGTPTVGKTLTAKATSLWPSGSTVTYQWLRDGKPIPGATKATYKLAGADHGKKISVIATATKQDYASGSMTSKQVGPVKTGTLKSAKPTISGPLAAGQTVTAKPATWTSGTSFSYQWLRDGKAIKGATKPTYKLTSSDVGKRISVTVKGRNAGYTTVSRTSSTSAKVMKAAKPKITGKATVGSTLKLKRGSWTSGVKFTYQWLRDGKAIKRATKTSYKLTKSDIGKKMSVKVIGKRSGYATVTLTSAATAKTKAR